MISINSYEFYILLMIILIAALIMVSITAKERECTC